MAKKTLRFLKRSRFTGQYEPLDAGTVREFDVGEGEGKTHPDVIDALTRGAEPMAEELDAGEVAALRKAEAKAAAAAKRRQDEEEGIAPPPTSKPKAPAKPKGKGKQEEPKESESSEESKPEE